MDPGGAGGADVVGAEAGGRDRWRRRRGEGGRARGREPRLDVALLRGGEDQNGEEEEVRARSHRRHAVVGRRCGVEERKCGGGEVGFKAGNDCGASDDLLQACKQ
jgi:hypothetical protein